MEVVGCPRSVLGRSDERAQLRPLAVAAYRAPHAIQAPPAAAIRPPWPKVEQRALAVYDQLVEGRA